MYVVGIYKILIFMATCQQTADALDIVTTHSLENIMSLKLRYQFHKAERGFILYFMLIYYAKKYGASLSNNGLL